MNIKEIGEFKTKLEEQLAMCDHFLNGEHGLVKTKEQVLLAETVAEELDKDVIYPKIYPFGVAVDVYSHLVFLQTRFDETVEEDLLTFLKEKGVRGIK